MSIPPPRGMSEVDYEAIEAAVTETVRGRWFLAEFARRNRLAETRQLLDAMARLEATVTTGQPAALPSADPSIRLLVQRIKEIAASLGDTAHEMRGAGVEEHFVAQVEAQARAVGGMMRTGSPSVSASARAAVEGRPAPRQVEPPSPDGEETREPRLPRAELPAALAPRVETAARTDPRLAAFASLDQLPIEEKLAIFR